MLKKFVSNALLSVVMDKDARQKLQDRQSSGATASKPAKSAKPGARSNQTKSEATSGEDVVDTIAQALAEARAEVSGERKSPERPAQGSLQSKRTPPVTPAPRPSAPSASPAQPQARESTPERERLIQEAMAIHRQKEHVLNDLDPAMREKLTVMAMYAMDPDSLPPEARAQAKADAEAEGLVDEIGGKARAGKKRPAPPRK